MTFTDIRLHAKARYQTGVLMRRYSIYLVEAEARAMWGNR